MSSTLFARHTPTRTSPKPPSQPRPQPSAPWTRHPRSCPTCRSKLRDRHTRPSPLSGHGCGPLEHMGTDQLRKDLQRRVVMLYDGGKGGGAPCQVSPSTTPSALLRLCICRRHRSDWHSAAASEQSERGHEKSLLLSCESSCAFWCAQRWATLSRRLSLASGRASPRLR